MSANSIIVLSGGFDPIHEGHIAMFKEAKNKYDYVLVGLNSDEWLTRKKGKPFMSFSARKAVLSSIKYVDKVVSFDDSDGSATLLLCDVKNYYTTGNITFGNGGDRANANYPELDYCIKNNIATDDSLGGINKMNSSSSLLDSWKCDSAIRDWGLWKVLHNYTPNTVKIKELIVDPGHSLSWQKHYNRSEVWFVKAGTATVHHSNHATLGIEKSILNTNDVFIIPLEKWHRLSNETKEILSIIEIQYGNDCSERDIVRLPFTAES
jgi:D-beta-D-heptose 7-phosphate kinase/D-beta-D-heptose 1-phosphate adenosyltransferase